MGKRITLGLLALLAVLAIFGWPYLNNLLGAGTGIVAKTLCSGIYVAKRDPSLVQAQDSAQYPDIFTIDINDVESIVKVSAGWREASAKHYPGVGCIRQIPNPELANDSNSLDPKSLDPNSLNPRSLDPNYWAVSPNQSATPGNGEDISNAQEQSWPQGGKPTEELLAIIDRPKLQRVIASAFADDDAGNPLQTRAVALVWRGQLIAERYAEGFTKTTPLMGWSMTKSITNALIGMRIGDGKLALQDTALLPQWQDAQDSRRNITLDALLRMSSGLAFNENYFDTSSDAVTMLFGAAGNDMAGYAANQPLEYPMDSHWAYSSGTTNLLQRILRNTFASTKDYWTYIHNRLLVPVGLHHTQLEPDSSGTLVGSSFGYASARDWARFGQLFLQDGIWEGQRLLPEGWVGYSTTPTPTAAEGQYGAHWWLNYGPSDSPELRPWPKLPRTAYRASGFEGQMVMVVPSSELVVVRLGLTVYPAKFDFETFTADVLQALAP